MGWTTDLLEGIAADLDTAGIGTYDPDAAVESLTDAVSLGAVTDKPDRQIGVQHALSRPDPVSSDTVETVQFWLRGDPQWVADTADAIFDRYEGAVNRRFGGIVCPLIHQRSDAPMGVDQRGRRERSLLYDFTASRPTASRPD